MFQLIKLLSLLCKELPMVKNARTAARNLWDAGKYIKPCHYVFRFSSVGYSISPVLQAIGYLTPRSQVRSLLKQKINSLKLRLVALLPGSVMTSVKVNSHIGHGHTGLKTLASELTTAPSCFTIKQAPDIP